MDFLGLLVDGVLIVSSVALWALRRRDQRSFVRAESLAIDAQRQSQDGLRTIGQQGKKIDEINRRVLDLRE